MKDFRCVLGRHAYSANAKQGQAVDGGEALVTCARCGKTSRVVFRRSRHPQDRPNRPPVQDPRGFGDGAM